MVNRSDLLEEVAITRIWSSNIVREKNVNLHARTLTFTVIGGSWLEKFRLTLATRAICSLCGRRAIFLVEHLQN